MYGHITPGGTVGQVFSEKPGSGRCHPAFLATITELPEGVGAGWRRINGQWLPPETDGGGDEDGLAARVGALEEAMDILTGGASGGQA